MPTYAMESVVLIEDGKSIANATNDCNGLIRHLADENRSNRYKDSR
jgi:hypothetical protein